MTGLPQWEVDIDEIVDSTTRERLVLKDQDRAINQWGREILVDNWKRMFICWLSLYLFANYYVIGMRNILPKAIWAIY